MSTFSCPVIRIEKLADNPNSDNLCVIQGPQGPLQFRKGELKEGDLACFIPADSLVPVSRPEFAFLGDKADKDGLFRVRGVKLRGIPSVGLLVRSPDIIIKNDGGSVTRASVVPGDDLSGFYGITKYESPDSNITKYESPDSNNDEQIQSGRGHGPTYDIENVWKFKNSWVGAHGSQMVPASDVVTTWSITQKIHGCNCRFYYDDNGELHIGSRNRWLRPDQNNPWTRAFFRHRDILSRLLSENVKTIFYGEVFGKVQDLTYSEKDVDLRLFDAYENGQFLPIGELGRKLMAIPDALSLLVPQVSQFVGSLGMAIEAAKEHCSGLSLIDGKTMREGVVVRPSGVEILTTTDERLITKVVSPEYLSRKGGTEYH